VFYSSPPLPPFEMREVDERVEEVIGKMKLLIKSYLFEKSTQETKE